MFFALDGIAPQVFAEIMAARGVDLRAHQFDAGHALEHMQLRAGVDGIV